MLVSTGTLLYLLSDLGLHVALQLGDVELKSTARVSTELDMIKQSGVKLCQVHVNVNERVAHVMVAGSVMDMSQQRANVTVGSSSDVSLKVEETDISQLNATITTPSGPEEPCMLKRLPNGCLGKHMEYMGQTGEWQ